MHRLFRLGELELAARCIDAHPGAFAELALQHAHRERIQHAPLDDALQRPRAVDRIVALGDEHILRAIGQLDVDLAILEPLHQAAQLDVDDASHLAPA